PAPRQNRPHTLPSNTVQIGEIVNLMLGDRRVEGRVMEMLPGDPKGVPHSISSSPDSSRFSGRSINIETVTANILDQPDRSPHLRNPVDLPTSVTDFSRIHGHDSDVALNNVINVHRRKLVDIDYNATYQCGGVLGSGSFGKVYLVLRTADRRQLAMKTHDFRHPMDASYSRGLVEELTIQSEIKGLPFLLGLHDVWYSSAQFLHAVTDLCPGGSLAPYVGKLSDKQMFLVIAEVLIGLSSLHEKGIIHHDIKPQNILIDSEGHCVIADFGLAQIADNVGLQMAARRNPGGTAGYLAPEINIFTQSAQILYWDSAVDYWSLGATIFYLQTGDFLQTHQRTQIGQKLQDPCDIGWDHDLPGPFVEEYMKCSRAPSTLIELVQKLTYFDKTQRWKGPRVKEADYFDVLSRGPGWHEIASKKYALKEDVRAAIDDLEREVTLPELLDALWQNKVPMREDDVLLPGVHFQPREYPDRYSREAVFCIQ
ncbi:hypothetical protein HWV62_40732, partial [Athelia sp. TMB]